MYETIVWATDGSEGADLALEEALGLTRLSGGRLVAVHCDQQLSGRAAGWAALPDEEDRRRKIRRQAAELKDAGVDVGVVVRRSQREAADVVAAAARKLEADVIVCGTRGEGALAGAVLGSFAHRLLHAAPCPVLVVSGRVERTTAAAEAARTRIGA